MNTSNFIMKKVAPQNTETLKTTSMLSLIAPNRIQRSKSLDYIPGSTWKSSVRPRLKPSALNSNLLNINAFDEYSRISRKNATATCTKNSNQLKSAQQRQAETSKQPPKLSKFDYKGRLALLDEKHRVLIRDHKEMKIKCKILEQEYNDIFQKLTQSEDRNWHLQQLCNKLESELCKTNKQHKAL